MFFRFDKRFYHSSEEDVFEKILESTQHIIKCKGNKEATKIPIHSKDRTEEHPIVIGGGPCAYNPEPIADFFDIFYIVHL